MGLLSLLSASCLSSSVCNDAGIIFCAQLHHITAMLGVLQRRRGATLGTVSKSKVRYRYGLCGAALTAIGGFRSMPCEPLKRITALSHSIHLVPDTHALRLLEEHPDAPPHALAGINLLSLPSPRHGPRRRVALTGIWPARLPMATLWGPNPNCPSVGAWRIPSRPRYSPFGQPGQ